MKDALTFNKEVPLKDLRNGAVFVTRDGVYAVKSEHHFLNGISVCVSLANGEYTQFKHGNLELVREVRIAECAGMGAIVSCVHRHHAGYVSAGCGSDIVRIGVSEPSTEGNRANE